MTLLALGGLAHVIIAPAAMVAAIYDDLCGHDCRSSVLILWYDTRGRIHMLCAVATAVASPVRAVLGNGGLQFCVFERPHQVIDTNSQRSSNRPQIADRDTASAALYSGNLNTAHARLVRQFLLCHSSASAGSLDPLA
jgi:hypothetical protein